MEDGASNPFECHSVLCYTLFMTTITDIALTDEEEQRIFYSVCEDSGIEHVSSMTEVFDNFLEDPLKGIVDDQYLPLIAALRALPVDGKHYDEIEGFTYTRTQ